ncbi:MAG TPA: hypothetical protein VKB88_12320 [Bryobacteraceae bacterium]|nr:hypothetical protein [Bryobacteraceae bacterium]
MKRVFTGFAAALAVAWIASLVTARRIEAQYSSPVKVVNSTAAPAITSRMDDQGRIPYQSVNNSSQCGGSNYCYFSFGPVPAGHRLVITQVAGLNFFNQPSGAVNFDVSLLGPGAFQTGWLPAIRLSSISTYNYPVTVYVDAGQTFRFAAEVFGTTFSSSLDQQATITGYMLDCTAAPCSAIAQ